jgi:hypothetical protein
MSKGDAWEQLSQDLAARVDELVMSRVTASLERFMSRQVKLIYTETEAAKFLGVGKDRLQAWRRRRLISASRYPKGRLRPVEKQRLTENQDVLGDDYFYDIASLLSFHRRYVQEAVSPDTFEIQDQVHPFGAEISQPRLRAVGAR